MSDWSSGTDAAGEVYSTQAGEPGWIDDAAETVIRAFLSVQPSIRWCEEHSSVSMKEPGDEDGFDCQIAHLLNALQPCRIVERKLVDAPRIG